jgi:hypothetical protein
VGARKGRRVCGEDLMRVEPEAIDLAIRGATAANGGDEELATRAVGMTMAVFDAMEAIRDGKPWRGMSDPKQIAARVMRDAEHFNLG